MRCPQLGRLETGPDNASQGSPMTVMSRAGADEVGIRVATFVSI
jgi:hypothetical protein